MENSPNQLYHTDKERGKKEDKEKMYFYMKSSTLKAFKILSIKTGIKKPDLAEEAFELLFQKYSQEVDR